MADDIPVKVFVRARPFSEKEKLQSAGERLQMFVESNQISCDGRAFTFDGVLDPSTSQDTAYDVTASEKIRDLLSPSEKPLQVRERDGNVFVQGLSKNKVENLAETMVQLEKGSSLRSKGQTAMNAQSSRSHAILTISLEKEAHGDEDAGFAAKLHLVDLAGSERLKKTQTEGTRKEWSG
ncbi:unnamed protein product [Nippostrongylus brasiliensis]|uniref:Kinesin-like protein n=1 Tax=Nippostrongylus brasiliensis TaxID=27835 RepID=A0A0N4Y7G3_NIPBR|nr:unnamed protein product [Nippostrongylus brasiliensis]